MVLPPFLRPSVATPMEIPSDLQHGCGVLMLGLFVLFLPGHAEVVEILLDKFDGIDVDARNKLGITPLIKACVTGKRKCVQLLLDKGELADRAACWLFRRRVFRCIFHEIHTDLFRLGTSQLQHI